MAGARVDLHAPVALYGRWPIRYPSQGLNRMRDEGPTGPRPPALGNCGAVW